MTQLEDLKAHEKYNLLLCLSKVIITTIQKIRI